MSLRYTVEGTWPFPLDMLRHDGSVAASPEDQAKIDFLSSESAPDRDAIRTPRTIDLLIPLGGRRRPNAARWESFGWKVPGEAVVPSADAERRRMAVLRDRAMAKLTDDERRALRWFGLHDD